MHPLRLFLFAFSLTAAFVVSRTVADAIFLSRIGIAALAPMFLVAALLVGALSLSWARLTSRLTLSRVVLVTQIGSMLTTGLFIVLLTIFPNHLLVVGGLYLLTEIRGCLSTILVALLLNDGTVRDSRKHHFAYVNSASPIAGMLMGLLVGVEANVMQPAAILTLSCFFDLLAIAVTFLGRTILISNEIHHLPSHRPPSVVETKSELQGELAVNGFASSLMALVVCKVFVLSLIAYEWKAVAQAALAADEQRLVAYFGFFYAVTDGLILFFQLFVAGRLLTQRRMVYCLLALPGMMAVAGCASLVVGDLHWLLVWLTVARGGIVMRRGLHDIALQILYGWLPASTRRNTVTHVLGLAKPMSEALAAAVVILMSAWVTTSTLAWLWLPVILVWFFVVIKLIRQWKELELVPETL